MASISTVPAAVPGFSETRARTSSPLSRDDPSAPLWRHVRVDGCRFPHPRDDAAP